MVAAERARRSDVVMSQESEMAEKAPLPLPFLDFLKANDIDPTVYTDYVDLPRYVRLRSDTNVDAVLSEVERELGSPLQPVPWLPGFYSLPGSVTLSSCSAYRRGEMFGIDAASGAAVVALQIRPSDHVLDLCAAPGAKLCMIADFLQSHRHIPPTQAGNMSSPASQKEEGSEQDLDDFRTLERPAPQKGSSNCQTTETEEGSTQEQEEVAGGSTSQSSRGGSDIAAGGVDAVGNARPDTVTLGTVTGVDISAPRLAACRSLLQKYRLADRVRLFLGDATTFSAAPPIPARLHAKVLAQMSAMGKKKKKGAGGRGGGASAAAVAADGGEGTRTDDDEMRMGEKETEDDTSRGEEGMGAGEMKGGRTSDSAAAAAASAAAAEEGVRTMGDEGAMCVADGRGVEGLGFSMASENGAGGEKPSGGGDGVRRKRTRKERRRAKHLRWFEQGIVHSAMEIVPCAGPGGGGGAHGVGRSSGDSVMLGCTNDISREVMQDAEVTESRAALARACHADGGAAERRVSGAEWAGRLEGAEGDVGGDRGAGRGSVGSQQQQHPELFFVGRTAWQWWDPHAQTPTSRPAAAAAASPPKHAPVSIECTGETTGSALTDSAGSSQGHDKGLMDAECTHSPKPSHAPVSIECTGVVTGSASIDSAGSRHEGYDKVLVDAECTHDGSLKHILKYDSWGWDSLPRRFLQPERLSTLFELQLGLLRRGFHLLRRGGRLAYCTCSFTVAQNEEVVGAFLKEAEGTARIVEVGEAERWPCRGGGIPGTYRFAPDVSNTSGLFLVVFTKL